MYRKFIILPAICLLLFSCGSTPPVSQQKLSDLLTDVLLLESGNQIQYNGAGIPEKIWKRDYAFVCKKHSIDTAEFRKAMDWYSDHPEIYAKVMEDVINRLQRMQVEPLGNKP